MTHKNDYILWFKEIHKEDIDIAGGKGANLGEMSQFDVPVPNGFVVTSNAYFKFLDENVLRAKIRELLGSYNLEDPRQLEELSHKTKKLILNGKMSHELSTQIMETYLRLGGLLKEIPVAVRSSATAEDLPGASFAGQQVTFLNVQGEANVVEKVRECWASLFEPRAIFYRHQKGFDHFKVGIAVPIQIMIPSEISGVMFTIDPITNAKNRIIIESVWGLGEYIVQGTVSPDTYIVDRDSLDILSRHYEKQTVQLTRSGYDKNKEIKVPLSKQSSRKLSDSQIKELAEIGKKIHRHYYYPQDIEWAFSKGKFYIVQTRPVTTVDSQKQEPTQNIDAKPILLGQPASPGSASGAVKIVKNLHELGKINPGDILVTTMTTPDFVPAMKKVVAIVTDKGGQTSHAAIVSRELGIPCVVGTKSATEILKNNQKITVDATNGKIYSGLLLDNKVTEESLFKPVDTIHFKTATKIYVNLAEPELADHVASQNIDGVGLLRAEFMIAQIGVHPKKLIHEKRQKEFISKLSEGLLTFCKAFNPRPVVYRATDFKTNEYSHLVGGKAFEPQEENPMIGYRGAFRYVSDPEVFELELEAIKQVRQKHGFKNLWLMIPFCRSPQELQSVKKIIAGSGLVRSPTFKLWLMVEIPVNVIQLEDFIEVGIDGVSIGSNDLTMLMLGVDRDNEHLSGVFNERSPAVLWALEKIIKTCHKAKITCSICGQAPSQYPDLAEKLVNWGITSLSINPDIISQTRELVYQLENKLVTSKWQK